MVVVVSHGVRYVSHVSPLSGGVAQGHVAAHPFDTDCQPPNSHIHSQPAVQLGTVPAVVVVVAQLHDAVVVVGPVVVVVVVQIGAALVVREQYV